MSRESASRGSAQCHVVVVTVASGSRYSVRVRAGRWGTGKLLHELPWLPVAQLGDAIQMAAGWARLQGYETYTD